jgi:hypothetical protein
LTQRTPTVTGVLLQVVSLVVVNAASGIVLSSAATWEMV